ncbi:hypothetical protein CDD83_8643 [Cordyceps sp. RAO-2017]|nr:hypothetical protein CDD83_8643 [Cordyceps sp. RAO-2017]
MSALTLVSFAISSLLLAAYIESLAQRSKAEGGLALSADRDMPRLPFIAYKYVPVVIVTLYSSVWAWVDQDIKRMQPWFEMSRPQGSRAKDSLLLTYPHDFVVIVPWKAAKKRHWNVFLSSTMMVIILFILTPLQPTIMGLGSVTHRETVNITERPDMNWRLHGAQDADVLPHAYAISWLGRPYPPFTTSKYALLPFQLDQESLKTTKKANFTAKTTKIWSDAACWPAEATSKDLHESRIAGLNNTKRAIKAGPQYISANRTEYLNLKFPADLFEFDIFDGTSCSSHVVTLLSREWPYDLQSEIGSHDGWRYGSFEPDCKADLTAAWIKLMPQNPTSLNASQATLQVTIALCQLNYYQQQVVATVSAGGFRVYEDSVQPISEPLPLDDKKFAPVYFHHAIDSGMQKSLQDLERHGIARPGQLAPRQFEIRPTLGDPIKSLRHAKREIKYALAGQNISLPELSDPAKLEGFTTLW